jgi:transposase
MTDSREGFERKTGGEAHKDVRRMIHQFPFYELQAAVVRDGKERGIRVDAHSVAYDSQTCPECNYASPGNLKDKSQRVEVIEHHGRRFERKEVLKRFECEKCGHTAHRDIVACVNALARNGQKDTNSKVRKRVRAAVKTQLEVTE